jgi:hypothetical protein
MHLHDLVCHDMAYRVFPTSQIKFIVERNLIALDICRHCMIRGYCCNSKVTGTSLVAWRAASMRSCTAGSFDNMQLSNSRGTIGKANKHLLFPSPRFTSSTDQYGEYRYRYAIFVAYAVIRTSTNLKNSAKRTFAYKLSTTLLICPTSSMAAPYVPCSSAR